MKKTFTLLCCLAACFITRAQLVETEPNDSISQANFVPFDSTMTGNTCTYTQLDFFKFVTPANGTLQVITSVNASGANPPQFSMDVWTKSGTIFQALSPARGVGVAKLDTLYWNCMAADTFIFLAHCNTSTQSCFDYSFSFSILEPAFAGDNDGNRSFATAVPLSEGVATEGQLGFKKVPGNLVESSYYRIVTTAAGAIRVLTEADYTAAGNKVLNLAIYNKNQQLLDSLVTSLGELGDPATGAAFFDCMAADTFYLRVFQARNNDCGWSYSVEYDVVPSTYGTDAEPNNSFVTANEIKPGQVKQGIAGYGTDLSDDYYHFFKPDEGFIEINAVAVTADTALSGIAKIRLYDNAQTLLETLDVPVGSYSIPQIGLLNIPAQASDSLYLRVTWPGNLGYCGSYSFLVTTETISGIGEDGLVPVSVIPNPSSSSFTFDLGAVRASQLQIFDMNGRLVELVTGEKLHSRFVNAGTNLLPGVYIARLFNGSEVSGVVRLVKAGM